MLRLNYCAFLACDVLFCVVVVSGFIGDFSRFVLLLECVYEIF